jgi:octaprenyl-diphosphate synthase
VDHVSHYRGKRLRPVLLLLTARACGKVVAAHHTLAAVVEMIHTATLVHDDVLDGARVRRRVPTVNALWGTKTSVLLGDYLFTHAFHLSATLDDVRACRIIGEATNRVCEGELKQGLERGNLELGEDAYHEQIDGKTAALIEACGRLGALFAGAPEDVVEAMARYARRLGVAFQIADDLLDLVGEEKTAGKSLGTDLEQQKLTLPLIRLRALCGGGSPEADPGAPGNHKRAALRPLLEASDALTMRLRRGNTRALRSELACLPPSPARAVLEVMCDRVVHRSA